MDRARVQDLYQKMLTDLMGHQPAATIPLCPLCLSPFVREKDHPSQPTVEHIIPESVGGTDCTSTLTCKRCNNAHGAALDRHLKGAMNALDFLSGKGKQRAVIQNDVGHISANLDWNDTRPVQINILGEKASNPAAVGDLRRALRAEGKLTFTLNLGLVPERFWRAVLRVAYLAAFHRLGYAYAFSKGGAQVRIAIEGDVAPNDVILSAYPNSDPNMPFIVHCLQDAIIVVFRLQSLTTRWLSVALPPVQACPWEDLGMLASTASRLRMVVDRANGPPVVIRFGPEPVDVMRNLKSP